MRKPELAAAIADRTGLSRDKAGEIITAFTDQILAAAARGEDVTLLGFGSFCVRQRAARNGRNPKTGEALQVPEGRTVAFRAGKGLKAALR
ncbi:HU family DNA-binding protein [Marinobacter lutaoensis]|jgi:DNA-binding protein HU-alpha|uniref:DNA-binding protein HU n=1 Tax=Marinobacter lutaoensis TaxID=135739 RepID=A0A1V2DPA7_9GAMM|nr:HU family DNA-binding protein [Marinobacter lutaoensis]MBE02293.1 HU family DNA-binding protein [Marinobacter sp.]MBI43227.1 HU family DNA-binding protein [Oceanospirillales bacterium]MBI43801.1 HU family DNA-binding protein [Oceanospirillales bacterium]NVD35677.1 HU family DNA-binding protein [Marinobacter lutaoensis]ONF42251.1 DNA-binding protein HU [Marinobacter lutaoensis]|tara:strand:+ start:646 stop:918 length:273 start_codon:yes stop_codon:yes gene_type:complete